MRGSDVPDIRVAPANTRAANTGGEFVLYWMIAARRRGWNFALQRAVGWSLELGRPLLVLEALRCGYPWASGRLHAFVLQGMDDNRRAFEGSGALYHPYAERLPGEGRGLLEALARRACVVVTDEFPCFFLPAMVEAAASRLDVLLERVDGNGLLPLRATQDAFPTAYLFRRFLQKTLPPHLLAMPAPDPLLGARLPPAVPVPEEIANRWPAAGPSLLAAAPEALASLPLDHSVPPAPLRGGPRAGGERLARFVARHLDGYLEGRMDLSGDATSGLSPYLHFGHISAHQVFCAVMEREGWGIGRLSPKASGGKSGWWGASASAEAFLDQLVTWRELGYHHCFHRPDYGRYESLPAWARATLERHAPDPRPHAYAPEQLAAAATRDALWNAAQRQLLREGRIHNYLRMLWGKKILEWTESPREALQVMTELNDRYALDGRDPNSSSGIFWTLGRYDRPWAPERPVFGRVRYMSSGNTARKIDVRGYLARYAE